jgi:hypothetical protein
LEAVVYKFYLLKWIFGHVSQALNFLYQVYLEHKVTISY